MVEPTAFSRIAPCPDENWKAVVTAFHEYLAQCRSALDASRKAYRDAIQAHEDMNGAKGHSTKAASKGLGLPRDAASHRSEHVYLLSAGASREPMEGIPASTGYRPSLWTVLGDEVEDSRKRKPKAA